MKKGPFSQSSLAKISRPKLSEVFARPRLFRLLDSTRKRKLCWVAGPPGTGKTTLAASYLDHRKLPGIWYHVDAGDEDPATFFYYLGLAAQKAAPRKRSPLPLLTPEYLANLPLFSRRYFRELFSRLPKPFMIVFDNYQEAPADSIFHQIIRDGMTEIPEEGHAIVISREPPTGIFAPLRADRSMEVIDPEQLRLNARETGGLVKLRVQRKWTKEDLERLHKRADGWAAGVVLLTEQSRTEEKGSHFSGEDSATAIFDYFAGEIFGKTDSEVQTFLLKSAFLPTMTAGMANEVTGLHSAGRILADLTRRHYFIQQTGLSDPVYRYHQLFREFLLLRAKNRFSPDDLKRLYASAAGVLEKRGWSEDAVHLLIEGEAWPGVIEIALKQAPTLIGQGRNKTLEHWLISIPVKTGDQTPWLQYWMGVCRLPFDPALSRNYFEKAFEQFKSQHDVAGTLLASSGAVDSCFVEWKDFSGLDRWIEWLGVYLQNDPRFPSEEIEGRVALSMVTAFMFRQPHHPDAHNWIDRVLTLTARSTDTNFRIQAFSQVAHYLMWMGDFSRAGLLIGDLRLLNQNSKAFSLIGHHGKIIEATYEWLAANHQASLRAVSEGLKRAKSSGVSVWNHVLFAQGVYATLSSGDLQGASGYLEKMASSIVPSRYLDISHFHYLSAWFHLVRNDLSRSLSHAEEGVKRAIEAGTPVPEALTRLGVAQVLFETGKEEKAMSHLSASLKIAGGMKSLHLEHMGLLLEAYFLLTQNGEKSQINDEKERKGMESLQRAKALGREQGYFNIPWWRPSVMAFLCEKALNAGIEVDYVQKLVRKRNLIPSSPPLGCEHWPWPVKIFTLGRFLVLKEGSPLLFTGKTQRKPLELLKALIAVGGKDVSETRLVEALWPESEGDKGKHAFESALSRLRNLMGMDHALAHQDGRLSLNPRLCWVDTMAFEHLLGERESAGKALALYQGRFLDESDAPWALSRREALHRRFLEQIGKIADCREEAGEEEKAVEWCQKGLEIDDLAEGLYRRIMAIDLRLGRRAKALALYEHCRQTLSARLGIEPSPATQAIYQKIMEAK
jgi:ATP/maltotriose-dependent transcriptional regulator MalT/DNA-binding SARP family transcriptional activator